jgi:excinuclease UvrABC ATPase subunit
LALDLKVETVVESIAQGTLEEVSRNNSSYTGQFLKKILEK